jgi:hypothetical protein
MKVKRFKEFINEKYESVNEGMSKSAAKKQIKIIDKMIDDETGGDGEPLTSETLQDLERERERLAKLVESSGEVNEATKTFYPNLWYVIGRDPKTNKWDFWKDAFSNKTGGSGMKDKSQKIEFVKDMMGNAKDPSSDQGGMGLTDVSVVKGSELAIMIQKGETSSKSLFESYGNGMRDSVNEATTIKGMWKVKLPSGNEMVLPKSFSVSKTMPYDGYKLYKGTYKLKIAGTKNNYVYYNQAFKSEVTLDDNDIINFDRMNDQGYSGKYQITLHESVNEAGKTKIDVGSKYISSKHFMGYGTELWKGDEVEITKISKGGTVQFRIYHKERANQDAKISYGHEAKLADFEKYMVLKSVNEKFNAAVGAGQMNTRIGIQQPGDSVEIDSCDDESVNEAKLPKHFQKLQDGFNAMLKKEGSVEQVVVYPDPKGTGDYIISSESQGQQAFDAASMKKYIKKNFSEKEIYFKETKRSGYLKDLDIHMFDMKNRNR